MMQSEAASVCVASNEVWVVNWLSLAYLQLSLTLRITQACITPLSLSGGPMSGSAVRVYN